MTALQAAVAVRLLIGWVIIALIVGIAALIEKSPEGLRKNIKYRIAQKRRNIK